MTRGDRAPSERSSTVRPRIVSAASRPWYLPMCVSRTRPLTSPIAYSQSWPGTRRSSSTRERPVRLDPDRLEADARRCRDGGRTRRAPRRPRTSSRRRARSRPRRDGSRAPPGARSRTSTPPSSSASSTWAPANGSSRSISRSPRWTSVTCRPERRPRLGHLDADDAAAEDREPGGTSFAVVASMFVHGRASRRPSMSGISAPRPGRDDHGLAGDELLAVAGATVDHHPALAVEPARGRERA